jgi:hypothetical protein
MGKFSARAMCTLGIVSLAVLVAFAAFAGLATRSGEARPALPRYGNIFQSGGLVGWATGVRISALDSSIVEFEQISHARQLRQQSEFEYGGLKMRMSQVVQVDYPQGGDADRTGPDKTLLRVTAKIQRSH